MILIITTNKKKKNVNSNKKGPITRSLEELSSARVPRPKIRLFLRRIIPQKPVKTIQTQNPHFTYFTIHPFYLVVSFKYVWPSPQTPWFIVNFFFQTFSHTTCSRTARTWFRLLFQVDYFIVSSFYILISIWKVWSFESICIFSNWTLGLSSRPETMTSKLRVQTWGIVSRLVLC